MADQLDEMRTRWEAIATYTLFRELPLAPDAAYRDRQTEVIAKGLPYQEARARMNALNAAIGRITMRGELYCIELEGNQDELLARYRAAAPQTQSQPILPVTSAQGTQDHHSGVSIEPCQ